MVRREVLGGDRSCARLPRGRGRVCVKQWTAEMATANLVPVLHTRGNVTRLRMSAVSVLVLFSGFCYQNASLPVTSRISVPPNVCGPAVQVDPISREVDEALRKFMDKTPAMAVLKVGGQRAAMRERGGEGVRKRKGQWERASPLSRRTERPGGTEGVGTTREEEMREGKLRGKAETGKGRHWHSGMVRLDSAFGKGASGHQPTDHAR